MGEKLSEDRIQSLADTAGRVGGVNTIEKQMGRRFTRESGKRAAVRVSIETPGGRIGRIVANAAGGERRGIGETQMPVGTQDEYRAAAPGPVELRERRIASALVLVQPIAEKPLAVGQTFAHRLDAREQQLTGLDGRGTHVLPAGDPGRIGVRMTVGIDDAGNGGASLEIDYLRVRPFEDLEGAELTCCDNPPVTRRQRGYEAPCLVESRELGVL